MSPDNRPTVTAVPFELLRVAQGHEMEVSTLDGVKVILRIPTADELIAQQVAALATLPEGMRPDVMSRQQAEQLVRPLPS